MQGCERDLLCRSLDFYCGSIGWRRSALPCRCSTHVVVSSCSCLSIAHFFFCFSNYVSSFQFQLSMTVRRCSNQLVARFLHGSPADGMFNLVWRAVRSMLLHWFINSGAGHLVARGKSTRSWVFHVLRCSVFHMLLSTLQSCQASRGSISSHRERHSRKDLVNSVLAVNDQKVFLSYLASWLVSASSRCRPYDKHFLVIC